MRKGVDVGGTFVKVLWEDGRKEKYFVGELRKDREGFLKRLREIVLEGRPTGVGLAVAGFTSREGKVYKSPNIPAINGVDLKGLFEGSGAEVFVGNDVSLGAYGEWFFDHRDSEVLLLVAVGTGLGGGLVVGGRPFFGACGSALEIGHHIIVKDGYRCSCGRRGCWEAYCSSYGLERMYRELGGGELRGFEVVERAKDGEERAIRAIERFKEYLYTGLLNMVHILNPDRVILAGGLVLGIKEFLGDADERVRELSEDLPASCLRITFSEAGEFFGARGALAFILRKPNLY